MNETQALVIFIVEPFFLVIAGILFWLVWQFINNFKQKRLEAIEDKSDSAGDESVANARRAEMPKNDTTIDDSHNNAL